MKQQGGANNHISGKGPCHRPGRSHRSGPCMLTQCTLGGERATPQTGPKHSGRAEAHVTLVPRRQRIGRRHRPGRSTQVGQKPHDPQRGPGHTASHQHQGEIPHNPSTLSFSTVQIKRMQPAFTTSPFSSPIRLWPPGTSARGLTSALTSLGQLPPAPEPLCHGRPCNGRPGDGEP